MVDLAAEVGARPSLMRVSASGVAVQTGRCD